MDDQAATVMKQYILYDYLIENRELEREITKSSIEGIQRSEGKGSKSLRNLVITLATKEKEIESLEVLKNDCANIIKKALASGEKLVCNYMSVSYKFECKDGRLTYGRVPDEA